MAKTGRPHTRDLYLIDLRPTTVEDIANLGPSKQRNIVSPDRIRDSHHRVARMAASGVRNIEIARRTGYTVARVSQILNSPAMAELVQHYRDRITDAFVEDVKDDYNMARESWRLAHRLRLDILEDAVDGKVEIPLRELNAIASDGEDRFGTTKKSTNINLNADFAAELERALSRSARVEEGRVIEVEASPEGLRRRV